MGSRYTSFKDFYPFYLSEHADRNSRRLHFIGTSLGLVIFIAGVITQSGWLLVAAFVAGYAFAFSGHYLFEKNHPATFKYPLYSFAADWVMWKDILTGRMRF
ncbi:MAG TPA: DUF962 domain-containing protein [Burkholderiales bacterium]|jgi:hypothetical protein|nr:DUF962 domain-containing protein [Burkholderiales bacterium]